MIIEGSWLMAVLLGGFPAVGVIGRFLGDDESGDGDDEAVDDLLNDSFDDEVAFDSLEEDDEMFEEPESQAVDDLENRVEDMEAELGNLSSTVSTVRSENEEIADVVENIEDDVRKLLEIYEMVTRGINPFIDDDVGFSGEGTNASIQLFEDDDGADDGDEEIDDELLEADADEFFDEEAIDDEPLETSDPTENDTMDMDASSGGGGKSFEELKEEYESGDADWAEESDSTEPTDPEPIEEDPFEEFDEPDPEPVQPSPEPDEPVEPQELEEPDPEPAEPVAEKEPEPEEPAVDPDPVEESTSAPTETNGFEEPEPSFEDELTPEVAVEDFDEPIETDEEEERAAASTTPSVPGAAGMEKPYLQAVPGHPVAELAVMEWLEYLVRTTGTEGARPAVRYYGRIGWIADDVVEDLHAYLDGYGADETDDDELPVGLGRAEHVATLQYLLAIDGASTRQFVGTNLDSLLTEGVLGVSKSGAPSPDPTSPEDGMSDAEFGAGDSEGAAGFVDEPPEVAEETTLPDGGLALPLDEQPSTGVGGDGD